ncbi:MAG TPA: heme A synthase, partial [Betaproteobacteria bacterium]|nr:heme A synthase [Betaproteobacteria bacterium]
AFLIFGAITWTTLSVIYPSKTNISIPVKSMYKLSVIVSFIIFLMVLSGGFVAGLRAGLIYNTFPLMGDRFIPPDLFSLTPLWSNFFENMITVQFDHRIIAYILAVLIPVFWFRLRRRDVSIRTKNLSSLLLGLLVVQIALGVSTLMLHVPTVLGVAHQGVGSLLFITSLAVTQSMTSRRGML